MGIARIGSRFRHVHEGRTIDFVSVDVGNPHAVTFGEEDVAQLDELGASLNRSIPGGVNVELGRVDAAASRVAVTVFERGVGRTLACGTGACAAAVAAVAEGYCEEGRPLQVVLPGGALTITAATADAAGQFVVQMSGPARRVFIGELSEVPSAP
jgi:diaminopimelate epimerase